MHKIPEAARISDGTCAPTFSKRLRCKDVGTAEGFGDGTVVGEFDGKDVLGTIEGIVEG